MDIRRSIKTTMWSDQWIESLTAQQKLLWVYLLTNGFTNMLGIYPLTKKRIVFETALTESDVDNSLKLFESGGKCYHFFGEFIFLPNWMKNQSMNTNMIKSANDCYLNLPKDVISKLIDLNYPTFESLSNGTVTLPKKEEEIEIRKEKFIATIKSIDYDLPETEIDRFIEFWTAHNAGDKKMNFERCDKFYYKMRLSTWKKNYEKGFNRFAKPKKHIGLVE